MGGFNNLLLLESFRNIGGCWFREMGKLLIYFFEWGNVVMGGFGLCFGDWCRYFIDGWSF